MLRYVGPAFDFWIQGESGPVCELRRSHRAAKQEALRFLAAFLAQPLALFLCLDAFGDHVEPKAAAKIEDRPNDGSVRRGVAHSAHERLVNLEAGKGIEIRLPADSPTCP